MINVVILSLCSGSVFLLSYLLIINPRKVNDAANRWLGIFLSCFGFALLSDLFRLLGISEQYPLIGVFSEITRFAGGPALYLSVSCFSQPDRSIRKGDVLHFIPLLLFIVNCIPVLVPGFSGPMFSNRFESSTAAQFIRMFMFLILKVQFMAYWVASFLKLIRHQKNMRQVYSSLESVDLNWLKYFLICLLLVLLLWFNEAFFGIDWINDISAFGYLVAIYTLSYFAIKQKEIFPFQTQIVADITKAIDDTNDIAPKQRVAPEKIDSLTAKLKILMETEHCFLDHDLGLPDLAEKMSITSHEMSYLLNKGLGISFFEFVNGYRVEEAKRLLLSHRHHHLNMLGIAYQTGFNSKTTFYTAFKKATGKSPSEFKKLAGT